MHSAFQISDPLKQRQDTETLRTELVRLIVYLQNLAVKTRQKRGVLSFTE